LDERGAWGQHLKSRAQQFFGLVYYQTTHELPSLQPQSLAGQTGRPMDALPLWLLTRVLKTNVFADAYALNQVAANEYRGRAGIAAHVEDPMSFGPNLATVSLLAPVELTLTPTEEPSLGKDGVDHGNWIKVLLEPRSLLVLQGESRYAYRHGIRKSKLVRLADGSYLRRAADYRRISLTFRELLPTRRQLPDEVSSLGDQSIAPVTPAPTRVALC